MSSIRRVVKHVLAFILPWPARAERKAAITEASRQRDTTREKSRHAERTAAQIRQIAYEDNGFASGIVDILRRRQQRELRT